MSRIGKRPIALPQGVQVLSKDGAITVKGSKGTLSYVLPEGIEVKAQDSSITVEYQGNQAGLHGVARTCLYNMVTGVGVGFSKELDIVGIGFKAAVKGQTLSLNLGFSHVIDYALPEGITAKVDNNTHVTILGIDKVLVGMVASKVRSYRPPEPYQGKGVRYTGEVVQKKQGKAAGAK